MIHWTETVREGTQAERREKYWKQAQEAFGHHELKREGDQRWVCRRVDAKGSFYWFRVILAPYTIIVTGDIGDLILHISDSDPLPWLRGVADLSESKWGQADYAISKAAQVWRDERVFFVNEAKQRLEEMRKEGDDARATSIEEIWDLDNCEEHEVVTGWFEAYNQVVDSEVPECDDHSHHCLFVYQALGCFVRLMKAQDKELDKEMAEAVERSKIPVPKKGKKK